MKLDADLHIHSVLSPCADLLMGYKNIFEKLILNKIKVFSITDHNCTKNAEVFSEKACENGLIFIPGIEVQTAEEVHVVVYFKNVELLNEFGKIIEQNLQKIKNDEEIFGYQLILDRDDEFCEKEEGFLAGSTKLGINAVYNEAKKLDGIVVPAHLDRTSSLISNFGYIPPEIDFDCFEVYNMERIEEIRQKYKIQKAIISSSDAHFPDSIKEAKMYIETEVESVEGVFEAMKKGKVFLK